MTEKRIEGREGTSTEFVEFRTSRRGPAFIAQRGSQEHWFVFECYRGKNAPVITRDVFAPTDKESAVICAQHLAFEYCIKWRCA
jgi:hypothetical protein